MARMVDVMIAEMKYFTRLCNWLVCVHLLGCTWQSLIGPCTESAYKRLNGREGSGLSPIGSMSVNCLSNKLSIGFEGSLY